MIHIHKTTEFEAPSTLLHIPYVNLDMDLSNLPKYFTAKIFFYIVVGRLELYTTLTKWHTKIKRPKHKYQSGCYRQKTYFDQKSNHIG